MGALRQCHARIRELPVRPVREPMSQIDVLEMDFYFLIKGATMSRWVIRGALLWLIQRLAREYMGDQTPRRGRKPRRP
jgi:hypothetical protein